MKIAIYANMRGDGGGGVQALTAALIKALGQLDGPEHYVLIGPPKRSGWLEEVRGHNQTIFQSKPDFASVVGRVLSHGRRAFAFSYLKEPYARRALQRGPGDVVHLSNGVIESLGANVIHFPSQHFIITSLPSVYNPHDLQHLHLPQFFKPEELLRRELSYPFACRLATRVVVASEWIAADVRERYALPAAKVVVVPWGGQTDRYREPTPNDIQRARQTYQIPGRYIFYPAIPWPHKNHVKLLEAFALLRAKWSDLTLALCGKGTEGAGQFANSARRQNQSDGVRFLGHVPGSDMRPLFKGAEVLAVPTLFEAVSGPVAEAWLEGTPVACSDIPQLRAQAEGAAVFFDPMSSEAIASSLERILFDKDLRVRLAKNGQEKLSALTWQKTAERYRSVYRDAALSNLGSSARY